MIDQFTPLLETCWFLSPPWRNQIPLVEINLLERVYIRANKTFGFCCGVQWRNDYWLYTVVSERSLAYFTYQDIIGTGRLETTTIEQPAFVLGDGCANVFDERVMLRTINDGPRQRLILGVQLLNESWSYYVEWMSPVLVVRTSFQDRLALVPQTDLVRVNI